MGATSSVIRSLRSFIRWITLAAVICAGWAWSQTGRLPPEIRLLAPDDYGAIQGSLSESESNIQPHIPLNYGGIDYILEPVASYELSGLLVTHNNIHAFDDIYHTSNSVDVKDLCVIWGANLREQVYRGMKFWSEPFSCWAQTDDREVLAAFRFDQLSNTHVLAPDPVVRSTVRNMRVGDEIRIRGSLVNYYPRGEPERVRRSSVTRDDTGNGACEVMLVREATILNAFNHNAYDRLALSVRIVFVCLVLQLALFILQAYADAHRW